jgi:hypothetical protein
VGLRAPIGVSANNGARRQRSPAGLRAPIGWGNPVAMPIASDIAELSSLRTLLTEMTVRVTVLADRYRDDPDAPVAPDLFSAERQLAAAARHLERATTALEHLR